MPSSSQYMKVENTAEVEDIEQTFILNKSQRLRFFGDSSAFSIAFKIISFCSLLLNVFFLQHLVPLWGRQDKPSNTHFAGLKTDILVPYLSLEETYKSLHDPIWHGPEFEEGLSIVALDLDYIQDKGLSSSFQFPWDDNKRVYMLAHYHTLHCLLVLRQSVLESSTGRNQTITVEHLTHCLNTLLEDTMCHVDDTPRSMDPKAAAEESRLCRDRERLSEWSLENTACWAYVDDPNAPFEEKYKSCPDGRVLW